MKLVVCYLTDRGCLDGIPFYTMSAPRLARAGVFISDHVAVHPFRKSAVHELPVEGIPPNVREPALAPPGPRELRIHTPSWP